MHFLIATLFCLSSAACIVLVVFQLPGAWIILALAALIEYLDRFYLGDPAGWTFPPWALLGCVVLAGVGELIEFLAGVAGATRAGATRRGVIGSLIGGIAGIFIFTPLFFFVPVFGSLLGALLGTFVGAVVGELSAARATMRGSLRPALGATIGRILGTTSKVAIAIVIWLVLSVAAFL